MLLHNSYYIIIEIDTENLQFRNNLYCVASFFFVLCNYFLNHITIDLSLYINYQMADNFFGKTTPGVVCSLVSCNRKLIFATDHATDIFMQKKRNHKHQSFIQLFHSILK